MIFKKIALMVILYFLSCACLSSSGPQPRRQSLFGSLSGGQETVAALDVEQPTNTPGRLKAGASMNAVPNDPISAPGRTPQFRMPARGELARVDGNVWRTNVDASQLFAMLSRFLSQNYLLTSVDRKNLTLNTDWDKFFIDGRLFRNRLSISVFPVSQKQTEVVVKNSVEYFAGNPNKPEEATVANWLPSPDITDEVTRVVDSLNKQIAFYQNQSPALR